PQQIDIASLCTLGNDGRLYKMLPDGQTVEVTPKAPRKFYSFTVGPTKHKLHIVAEDHDLSQETPEFCVGQHITFDATWDQEPPAVQTNSYDWVFSSKYVNHSWQLYEAQEDGQNLYYGSVNYDIDP